MSLPQHFNIVAVAEHHKGGADLAAAAPGILRNLGDVGYTPYFVASSTYKLTSKLSSFALRRNILLSQRIKPILLNASRMDLWLALTQKDDQREWTCAKVLLSAHISKAGCLAQSDHARSFCVE